MSKNLDPVLFTLEDVGLGSGTRSRLSRCQHGACLDVVLSPKRDALSESEGKPAPKGHSRGIPGAKDRVPLPPEAHDAAPIARLHIRLG